MADIRYTPEGLPIVSPEVLDVLDRDQGLTSSGEDGLVRDVRKISNQGAEMRRNNPLLFQRLDLEGKAYAEELGQESEITKEQLVRMAYQIGAETCYKILKVQAEINSLESS